jgi:hypothetical protein
MGINGSPDAVDSTVDAAEDRLCYIICHEPETTDDAPFMYGKSELSTAPSQLCLAPGTRRLLDCVRPCTCRGSAGWAHARCVAVAAVHKPFTGAGSMFPGSRSLRCACRRCG